MRRERSGFLLPGIFLTLLACIGVTALVVSATGVLPDELPVLRSAGRAPRRSVTAPAPAPAPRPRPTTVGPSPSARPVPTYGPAPVRPRVTSAPPSTAPAAPRPPAPVSCKAGSAKVAPVADAWVDQDAPRDNHGDAPTTVVASRDKGRNRRAYVRFAAPVVPKGCTVRRASLTMTARDKTGRRLLVRRASRGWSESSLTWANAPAPGGASAAAVVSGTTVTWSLGAALAVAPYGYVLTDAAENAQGSGEQTAFGARDGRGAPVLTVWWS